MCRSLPLLAALAGLAAQAQTPDTTAAWRYLPLAVGNEWHTYETYNNGYWTEVTQMRAVVLSEVAGAPGRFAVEWIRQYQQFPTSPVLTSRGTMEWEYDAATQRVAGRPTMPCPLGAPFGAPVACGATMYTVTGGHGQSVTVGSQTVAATRKSYVYQPNVPNGYYREFYEYAAGIGETQSGYSRHTGTDPNIQSRTLRFARVGGQEYGQRMSFPVADEATPAAGALALTVGPNPVQGTATLRYTLPVPGAVRLAVVDVLGREVAVVAEGEWPAGIHESFLDAGRLSPGVYVVRLHVGGEALTRRLTVVR